MTRLSIRHETVYRYGQPVGFGPQRLMIRPRDSHADRLVEASLHLSLPGETRWVYDALGNSLCWYTPIGQATELRIVSNLVIERFPAPLEELEIQDPQTAMPIVYSLSDRVVLNPFIMPATDCGPEVLKWLRNHMSQQDEPALAFLTRLTQAIHDEFSYGERSQPGVQTPGETIGLGSGTCRDFAWLMIETLRRLGYATRFVTGYLYSPIADRPDAASAHRGSGATHAWCDVFLPGLGWMEFDPTNGLVESPDLIRVGATRTPDEAAPISGAIIGNPGTSEMSVTVEVHMIGETRAMQDAPPSLVDA
jgi:transglutaminase-like putative cysteine protease